jgi:transcriptional regulator with XRE-family HTH domain
MTAELDPVTQAPTRKNFVIPTWSFGDRIRKARSIVGMTQAQFAMAIDVSDASLAQWETDRARPRDLLAVAKRVQKLTQVPAQWLLGLSLLPRLDSNQEPSGLRSQPCSDVDESLTMTTMVG